MGILWNAAYDSIAQLIQINPCSITWERYPVTVNRRGETVSDTDAAPQIMQAAVRIAQERAGVQQQREGPAGLSANLSKFVIMLPDTDLRQDDVITEVKTGMKWKVGVTDFLSIEGEVYAKQAPLERAGGGDNEFQTAA